MRIIEYTPELFERMEAMQRPHPFLRHRPFVDYYYATHECARLFLAVDDDNTVFASVGGELMPFAYGGRCVTLNYPSHFRALRPGAAIYLLRKLMARSAGRGIGIGGTEESVRVFRSLGWTTCGEVRVQRLNQPYSRWAGENKLRLKIKDLIDLLARKPISRFASRIPHEAIARLSIHEESAVTEDMLPKDSPFALRFAPPLDHLNWRYNTRLSFARYRIFRLLVGETTSGYVVINESPERLLLAHCDGDDPAVLAYGALLSLLEVGRTDRKPRTMMLASTHSGMKAVFEQFGFRESGDAHPVTVGGLHDEFQIPSDTTQWLVNWDWGGRALRPPFLDQVPPAR